MAIRDRLLLWILRTLDLAKYIKGLIKVNKVKKGIFYVIKFIV